MEKQTTSSSTASTTGKSTQSTSTKESAVSSSASETSQTKEDTAIVSKVKDYILNQQSDKSYAESLNWSPTFFNSLSDQTILEVHTAFIKNGGSDANILDFATYLTKNAPIQENWKQLFEADFGKNYTQKITKYVDNGDGTYGVYVEGASSDTPFVTVSARTGNYHG